MKQMVTSKLAIQDIKQRLHNLGMMELDAPKRDQAKNDPVKRFGWESNSVPVSLNNGSSSIGLSSLDSPEAVRAKILQALNSPERADAVVPTSGKPESLKAVFIKSSGDDISSKLTILEELSSAETIKKSAPLTSHEEAMSITLGMEPITEYQLASPQVKNPQGGRKFHSWLSYFYPGSGRTSDSYSPHDLNLTEETKQPDNSSVRDSTNEIQETLNKVPKKSILKAVKLVSETDDFPPPIQKVVFLRQEEVQRLTKFAEKYKRGLIEEHGENHNRHYSGFARNRRIKFDLGKVRYHVTYSSNEYERGGVEYIAKSLTPEIAMMIKKELNEVKKEMHVHEESRQNTQFYQLR